MGFRVALCFNGLVVRIKLSRTRVLTLLLMVLSLTPIHVEVNDFPFGYALLCFVRIEWC